MGSLIYNLNEIINQIGRITRYHILSRSWHGTSSASASVQHVIAIRQEPTISGSCIETGSSDQQLSCI